MIKLVTGMAGPVGNSLLSQLREAIRRGDVNAVRALCDGRNGTDLRDLTSANGDSPLFLAATAQQFEVCRCLINECGASAMETDAAGRTPLIEMIRCRGATWKSKLLPLFKGTVNCFDRQGKTALMYAAVGAGLFGSRRGNLKIVSELIELGADALAIDNNGLTALGWAIKSDEGTSRNLDVIAYLKDEMKRQAAIRRFNRDFRTRFTEKGVLELEQVVTDDVAPSPRKRTSGSTGRGPVF